MPQYARLPYDWAGQIRRTLSLLLRSHPSVKQKYHGVLLEAPGPHPLLSVPQTVVEVSAPPTDSAGVREGLPGGVDLTPLNR